ncbi:F-box/LRR-repeat protein 2-like [Ptychodera flava]|uniref:F-box/LRR-repeat protein 2-like n=1 Tax=Ptychodera flava TaxID=63121 RepID=UPI00396A552C
MAKRLSDVCLECIANNLHTISSVGKYLPTVHKEILLERLANHDQLTPEYLPHISYHLLSPSLTQIRFYKCQQVTDALLKNIGKTGCKLQSITIHGCNEVTDAGIKAIVTEQDELHTLELRKLPHLTCQGLQHVASPVLKHVDLRQCSKLENRCVQALVNNNPSISTLIIPFCPKLSDELAGQVGQVLGPNLETLDIGGLYDLNDASMAVMAKNCNNLKKLFLHGCNRITKEALKQIGDNCRQLQQLDLSYCYKVSSSSDSEGLLHLPSSLQDLSLCGTQVNEETLPDALCRLIHLKKLKLCGIGSLTESNMEKIFSAIGHQLELVDFNGCGGVVTDDILRSVVNHCKDLESLALSFCTQVTGNTLYPLLENKKRAENITTLVCSGCRSLSYDVLLAIAESCVNLEWFAVAGIVCVNDVILQTLASNCHRLKVVNFKTCKEITDEGVCALASNCPLEDIVLSGIHGLTDKSVLAIANSCPQLDTIYLSGCALITPVAVRYLQDVSLKRIYVEHRTPNADPNTVMAKNLDTGEFCRVDYSKLTKL